MTNYLTYSHDVSEIAGLNAFSFGIEDVDRHTVVYKKEFSPSEDELNALRKGEEYDPQKVKLIKQLVTFFCISKSLHI
jgi:hypothetical protein